MSDKIKELLEQANELLKEEYKKLGHGGAEGARQRELLTANNKIDAALLAVDPTYKVSRQQEVDSQKGPLPTTYHESYGVMSMTRCSGTTTLVGSYVSTHNNYITLKIYPARRHEGLGLSDYTSHRHAIVEVSFSPDQLGDLIGSSSGRYVPCTIESVQGVRMDPPPTSGGTELQKIHDILDTNTDSDEEIEKAVDELIALKEDIANSSITKKLQAQFNKRVQAAISSMRKDSTNAHWAVTQLKHTLPEMIDHARTMLNSYIDAAVPDSAKESAKKYVQDTFGGGTNTQEKEVNTVRAAPATVITTDHFVTDEEIVNRFTHGDDWMAPDWHEAIKSRMEEITGSNDERLAELLEIAIKVDASYGPQEGFLKACAKEAAKRLDKRAMEDSLVLGAADRIPLSYLKQLKYSEAPELEGLSELISAIIDRRGEIIKPVRHVRD